MFEYAWLLLALPAAGALIILLVGSRLSKQAVGWLASGAVGLALVVSVALLVEMMGLPRGERTATITLWQWITIGDFEVNAALLVDPLSIVMALVVTGVGMLIHIYSIGYMEHDERVPRYFFYLNFFILAMLVLVLSDSFLGMFVGWEGVGLASYLLIGFWFDRRDDSYGYYADAGMKAFLVNRIGDFGMIVAMLALWSSLGTLTFLDVFEGVHHGDLAIGAANLICLMLLLAASGKSAQIPLFVWLPNAMAGPTPVSALIHAATMVTAGIYMIVRTHELWHVAVQASAVAAWIGVLTAFFAATVAVVQTDLKKILAYSTISQLGYMMLAVGLGAYGAAIFHLVAHAFFKALLFLAAGSVMHGTGGELDIRKMGGLRHKMPATFALFFIGAAALAGLPPWVGFFSKDAILVAALVKNPLIYGIGLVAALLTSFYSFRAVMVPFLGKPRDQHLYDHAHESPRLMTIPMWFLAGLSVVGGILNLPLILTLETWLLPSVGEHEGPTLSLELLGITMSVIIALFGVTLAWALFVHREKWAVQITSSFKSWRSITERAWGVDRFYARYIVQPVRGLAGWFATAVDQKTIDGTVNALASGTSRLGERVRYIESGSIPNYALSILLGVVLLVAFFVFTA